MSLVREYVLGKSNEEILEPLPISQVVGEVNLTGAAFEHQLALSHSSYIAFAPEIAFFCGIQEVQLPAENGTTDAKPVGAYYWFLMQKDAQAASPDHWLRTASKQEKFDWVMSKMEEIDDSVYGFREVLKLCGPEGVSDRFYLYHDAIIESLPVSRVTLLGDAAHPMTPCKSPFSYLYLNGRKAVMGYTSRRYFTHRLHDLVYCSPWRRGNRGHQGCSAPQ